MLTIRSRIARRRAFALVELAVVVVVILLAILIAGIIAPDARRRARLAGSIQNLQQIGKASTAFSADNDNKWFSLNWAPGSHTCGSYQFPHATTYTEAGAHQAVCILRERANRTDITAISSWFAHHWYSHLVLIDYLGGELPNDMLVSPGDAARLSWARAGRVAAENPNDRGSAYFALVCRPAGTGNESKRWPFSSSYEIQTSFVAPDAQIGTVPTVAQDPQGHRFYYTGTPQTVLGNRRMDEVRFPSQKAHLYESNQRFFGNQQPFFMYPEARVPVLFADASATVRSVNGVNPGFQPNSPSSTIPTRVNYTPELTWESPTSNGAPSQIINGGMRWTRSGLRGRDFMGPEIPWTP